MKISVIIPTYKPQSYIWECLDSLVNQTFPYDDFEIVLVLNGCKEPWESKIRNYISQHPDINFNFIQTDLGGVSNARNLALDVANGEYITFIDDDDYVSATYLEELYAISSVDTLALSYPFQFSENHPNIQLQEGLLNTYNKFAGKGKIPFQKARKYFAGPWMKLIHRSCIRDRRFDVRFKNGEDCLYMFLISDKFKYVNFTSKNSIYYRRFREGSAVMRHRTRKERLLNTLRGFREYCKMYKIKEHNFNFFLTRLLAEIKCIIMIFLK